MSVRESGTSTAVLVATVLLAVAGGVVGLIVWTGDPGFPLNLGVVVGAALLGTAVALLIAPTAPPVPADRAPARTPGRAPDRTPDRTPRPAADGWWTDAPTRRRPAAENRAPENRAPEPHRPRPPVDTGQETTRVVLPVDAAPGWWTQGPNDATSRQPAPRPAVADMAGYRRSARIVQCPRCGAFRIDVTHVDGAGYAFRCRVDDHEWTWRSGAEWPATVVASRRRTTS
ncbi:hypothetical protein WEH80_02990 [Actinomycetes bacterium KLBMP 9759]